MRVAFVWGSLRGKGEFGAKLAELVKAEREDVFLEGGSLQSKSSQRGRSQLKVHLESHSIYKGAIVFSEH